MKTMLSLVAMVLVSIAAPVWAQGDAKEEAAARADGIDATARFIFYSVLEGLYEDGLSNEDVEQILMKKEKQSYFHFIYACPVCNATIWALQAYRGRPDHLYGLKRPSSTFGSGLSGDLRKQLYSEDPNQRLTAINTLVQAWLDRRMTNQRLTKKERTEWIEALEKKRQEGMRMLQSYRRREHGADFGVAPAAPAYVDLKECAVCNGVVGKAMALPEKAR
jgi:hypothetical protein